MYIKKVTKKKSASGKPYEYLHLVENIRTEKGPRQRLILNLGTLNIPSDQYKSLANAIEGKLKGIPVLLETHSSELRELADHYVSKIRNKNAEEMKREDQGEDQPESITPTSTPVDVESIEAAQCRSIGAEYVAHKTWNMLGFNEILLDCKVSPKVLPLLEAQVVGRLVEPGSELHTFEWLEHRSAFYELSWMPLNRSLSSFYRAADRLLDSKDMLEEHLRDNERTLFGLNEKLCLFDLTNTYFEGSAANSSKAKRGRSKEKRTDCKLITLALVVDEHGFAKQSQLFGGNQSEAATLPVMIKELLSYYQSPLFKPTVVVDAGLATEENIQWLKNENFHYIMVSRSDRDLMPSKHMEIIRTDKDLNTEISVERSMDGDELKLLCYSRKKSFTSESIRHKQESRYTERLKHFKDGLSLKNRAKTYGRLQFMLGRLAQNNPSVARHYEVELICEKEPSSSPTKVKVLDIQWKRRDTYDEQELRDGCYVLRTDRTELTNREIWETYVMLTRVEQSFRGLKSSLGLRPNFHRVDNRIDAHLFISVLAYHLMNAIEYKMRKANDCRCWNTLKNVLSTHQRLTIEYKEEVGEQWLQRAIRVCSKPEEAHKKIYKALGLKNIPLPKFISKSL